MHTLKQIADHPGISATEIARDYGKTKGAVSQIIKKLEEKELICRKKDFLNDNKWQLYITEKGKCLDEAHQHYDQVGGGETMELVRELYTSEEIDTAFNVLESWLEIRRDVHQRRLDRKKLEKKILKLKKEQE